MIFSGDWEVATDASICTTPSNWLRPVVQCLPAWFRFAQCLRRYRDTREAFPHLVNAGKYSTTFFVVIFSSLSNYFQADATGASAAAAKSLFYAYLLAAVVSSLYAYAWDIKMDWGLLDAGAGADNPLLRDEIVYSSKVRIK